MLIFIDSCILEISARKAQPMAFNATDKGVEQFICVQSKPVFLNPHDLRTIICVFRYSQFLKRSTVKSLHKSCFLPTVIEMDLSRWCFHFPQGLCLFSSSL